MGPIIGSCNDGTCCCMPQNSMVALISLISFIATAIDVLITNNYCCHPVPHSCVYEHIGSLKSLLLTLFQIANLVLLISSVVENPLLVQIYIWYTLGFVLMELLITILDFAVKFQDRGPSCLVEFIIETASLFVLCQCLPLVDMYRSNLETQSPINYANVK